MEKGSIAKAKISGLRGQPCWVPLDREKDLEHNLLVITLALGDAYNNRIQDIMLGPNPNFPNTANKKG